MKIALRPARASEAEAIARVWHDGWRDAHLGIVPARLVAWRSLDRFRNRTSANLGGMQVAVRGGTTLGLYLLGHDEPDQFYVSPAARGTGLAQRLIADAEARLAARGTDSAWLACARGNTRARRFYEKAGWKAVRSEPMHIATDTDPITIAIWRMETRLTP